MTPDRFFSRRNPSSESPFDLPGFSEIVEIARGGFSVVYRATQPELRRTVAIKLVRNSPDGNTRERFERERMILGSLTGHPYIVTVFQTGYTKKGEPYIVMDYLSGGSLQDQIRRSRPLTWQEAAEVGVKMAGALETAHRANILHRDVKPQNILVSAYREYQLADFGLARLRGGLETRTGTVAMSLAHAAPEIVLTGAKPSVASDVYSLGSAIFTLIWGRPPFVTDADQSDVSLVGKIATASIPDLHVLGVPDRFCDALETAMATAPEGRFRTAEAFGAALQTVQTDAGIPVTSMRLREDDVASVSPVEPTPTMGGDTDTRVRNAGRPNRPYVSAERPIADPTAWWRKPIVLGSAAVAFVVLVLAIVVVPKLGSEKHGSVSGVTSPQPGTYRYSLVVQSDGPSTTTKRGEIKTRILTTAAVGTEVHQRVDTDDPNSPHPSQRIVWQAGGVLQTGLVDGPGSGELACDWKPEPVLEYRIPLVKGGKWNSKYSCGNPAVQRTLDLRSEVTATDRKSVGGEMLDVWVIKRNQEYTEGSPGSPASKKVTTETEWFAASRGLVVQREGSTKVDDTAPVRYTLTLLNARPS